MTTEQRTVCFNVALQQGVLKPSGFCIYEIEFMSIFSLLLKAKAHVCVKEGVIVE